MRIRKTLWTNDAEPVIVIMVLLLVLGTLNVFSSSFVMATIDYDNPYYFLQKHAIMLVAGLIAFVFCRKFNYKRWRYLMPGMVFVILLSLAAVTCSSGSEFPDTLTCCPHLTNFDHA